MTEPTTLTPRLVVEDADRAIDVYREAFGAELLERMATPDGTVVHAALSIDGAVFSLTEHNPGSRNVAPRHLGGSPVILNLLVPDADAVGAALVAAGGTVIFPIADQFYGHREGRIEDPFGHMWIISTVIEKLTPAQIEARMRGG